MDNLTHSLVGVAAAKAGLERVSPYATTVCVVSANIADADFVTLFFGDRWTLLQHHRGITHSIVGTLAIGVLVPLIALGIERVASILSKHRPRIRLRGLLIASLITSATHPLMDWTNNYGVRPLLPWNGRWLYGDLVFIVDPYIWLVLGSVCFLLTGTTRFKTILWSIVGVVSTLVVSSATFRGRSNGSALWFAFVLWICGLALLIVLRWRGSEKRLGPMAAAVALCLVVGYWGGLALAHRRALLNSLEVASRAAQSRNEQLIKVAAMPMVATPLRWQSVAETDRAMYRFVISITAGNPNAPLFDWIDRYEKPTGRDAQLVATADQDRRAQILLDFARFPFQRVADDNCVGRTLVQFADLRYTEPGTARGNFSVNIPVDCPAR